jgi:hypothetical protein
MAIPKTPNPITPGDRPGTPFICWPFNEITSPKVAIITSSNRVLPETTMYFKTFFWFSAFLPTSTCIAMGTIKSNTGNISIRNNDMLFLFLGYTGFYKIALLLRILLGVGFRLHPFCNGVTLPILSRYAVQPGIIAGNFVPSTFLFVVRLLFYVPSLNILF